MNVYNVIGEHRDWRRVEVLLGALQFVWGCYALYPMESFSSPSYRNLGAIAPEWVWGLVFLLVGALVFHSARLKLHTERRVLSLAAVICWSALGLTVFATTPQTFGGPTYLGFAIACCMAYLSGIRCHVSHRLCNGEAEVALYSAAEKIRRRE